MTPWLLCPRGFSRQENCSGLPCPPPRDLPNPGNKPRSPKFQVDSLPSELPGKPPGRHTGLLKRQNRKNLAVKYWLDEDMGHLLGKNSVILHARKDGGDNENREKGGIFWESFDIKNLCKDKLEVGEDDGIMGKSGTSMLVRDRTQGHAGRSML